jgi:kumamolisin
LRFNVIDIPEGASRVGRLDPDQHIDLTIVLAQKAPLPSLNTAGNTQKNPAARTAPAPKYSTHIQLHEAHGAASESVEVVTGFAAHHNLSINEVATKRRAIRLSGRSADVERAFKTQLDEFRHKGSKFFAPSRPIEVPDDWDGIVEVVLGLHNSRHSQPRRHTSVYCAEPSANLHHLAKAYHFPEGLDGTGQTIGLIEFGGGFDPEDIEQFCNHMGLKAPKVSVVKIGTGDNRPASRQAVNQFLDVLNGSLSLAAADTESESFIAAQCTAEVTMDLEILAALAPGSHIVTYFAPSDEQGLYHALTHAVHDEQNKPDVLTISWSFPEHTVSEAEIHALERVLHEAAHLGITICGSSGDAGAMNGSEDGTPSVNYPASSPYCLACGGTTGEIIANEMREEVVWNASHFGIKGASGGGISRRFQIPDWQQTANVPDGPGGTTGRGVPDVAGLADPRYGCEMLMDGRAFASAGTSAVAPMWAALIARINQALGQRCGHLHSHLYTLGKERSKGLHPVLKGDNGYYHAGKGWNACVGYGSPRGVDLLNYLKSIFET